MSEITMEFKGEVKHGMVEKLNDAINDIRLKRVEELENKQTDEYGFVDLFFDGLEYDIVLLKTTRKFCLMYHKYHGKYCDTEEFAKFVAPFMKPQDILFDKGEESSWGFRIREDGSVVELENQMVETDVIYYPETGDKK